MNTISYKPLTVNRAWKGKRYKTDEYNQYERDLLYLLPKITVPSGPLKIVFEFGLSSPLSDWDNCIKTTQDILAKKYGFNDKMIVEGSVKKVLVKKGEEYIKFDLVAA